MCRAGRMRDELESIAFSDTLRPEEKRVRLYERVRDIPFAVRHGLFDPESSAENMLREGAGFCMPKHLLLGELFERMNEEVRWVVCRFKWSDPGFLCEGYPFDQARGLPETTHLYIELRSGDMWVAVDATWDRHLAGSGFPVNIDWDGVCSTELAVRPISHEKFRDVRELKKELAKRLGRYSLPEQLSLARFSIVLNGHLEKIRIACGANNERDEV